MRSIGKWARGRFGPAGARRATISPRSLSTNGPKARETQVRSLGRGLLWGLGPANGQNLIPATCAAVRPRVPQVLIEGVGKFKMGALDFIGQNAYSARKWRDTHAGSLVFGKTEFEQQQCGPAALPPLSFQNRCVPQNDCHSILCAILPAYQALPANFPTPSYLMLRTPDQRLPRSRLRPVTSRNAFRLRNLCRPVRFPAILDGITTGLGATETGPRWVRLCQPGLPEPIFRRGPAGQLQCQCVQSQAITETAVPRLAGWPGGVGDGHRTALLAGCWLGTTVVLRYCSHVDPIHMRAIP
jgi:hypothetical protein